MAALLNLEALMKEAGVELPGAFTPVVIPTAAAAVPPPISALPPALPTKVPVISFASATPAQQVTRKILLVGTHAHQTTGYSKVMYHLVKELAKYPQFELYHFGFQKFMTPPPDYRAYPPAVDVYDPAEVEKAGTAPQEMGFGFSQLAAYVRKVKPDTLFLYNDAGVICKFLDKLKEDLTAMERAAYKVLIYLDQVYITQRPELLARIDADAHAYFAFTTYWKTVLEDQGIKKPIHVLRHGFDETEWKVQDRATVRKRHGLPENLVVYLNMNRNTPRKRYDIVVAAFAELVARHPTKPLALMCACDGGEQGGFQLQQIFARELELRRVPPQFHIHKLMLAKGPQTFTDEVVNDFYSLSDVGVNAADGEGFGLCQFEAMGVGIPQVVSYVGGFRDFCVDGVNSLTVKPKYTSYIPLAHSGVGGIIEVVDTHEFMLAMETYLMDSELRERHGAAARTTVLSYKWSAEVAGIVGHLGGA